MTAEPQGNAALDRSFLEVDVDELLCQLTTEEKISLLAGKNWWETVSIPRLNVPSIKVTDGPNGARGSSFFKMTKASAIPSETCLASSFSTELVGKAGALLAEEAKARGAVCLLAPTINIQRSPLGGRAFESFSEDPTLSGHLAAAYVNGLQTSGVSACIKHFVCNDQEHERNGEDSIIAERALREIYLRPFQIAQREAGPWAMMTSYNKVNGTHVSENKRLLQDLLRKEWGYDGLLVSDWYGTYSVSDSINAGLSLEMPGPTIWRQPRMVQHLLTSHKLEMRTIDARAREVLAWCQKLAQLNPELVYRPPMPERTRDSDSERASDAAILRRLAGEGVVLLKNDGVLPIRQGRVAVIGPNAKTRVISGGGSAALRPLWTVNAWEGLNDGKPAGVDLSYSLGLQGAKFLPMLDECFTTLDGKRGFELLHYATNAKGEVAQQPTVTDTHDVSDMFLADFRHPGLGAHYVTEVRARFTSPITGRYEFGLSVTGQGWLYIDEELVIDNATKQTMGSKYFGNGTVEEKGSVAVEKGKTYTLRVVHDSRLPPSRAVSGTPFIVKGIRIGAFPLIDAQQAMDDAVAAARAADAVVFVAGLNADYESEGYDRPTLSLPLTSDELITRIAEANPNTVVVVQAGSAVSMPWASKVKGIMQAWYGGNEAGNGIADVVYGKRNPSGRLPLSFPVKESDIPSALNFKSARTRVHYDEGIWVGYKHYNARGIAPLFPFGHGLSYTTFEYSDLAIDVKKGDEWRATARATVTNTGTVKGDHSVHFYTAPPPESPTGLRHPEVTLQGFAKVYDLAPGKSATVEVQLDKYAISHWDEYDNTWKAEVGDWALKIGQDAQTMVAEVPFTVSSEMAWAKL
ncbi:putative beta-glucosidase [Cutaneotrichosporon oleaginosum]|uniref:beta-glucosidase n=1 Tax=Cutaneotrichosporon oleaginosum TaxID=879819 RepID=A0A0J0XQT4_9TREE|nr:putative beta-glucosidase [Cutaneotrichosporon oleaginosum]KLT43432.1 putative beta-glucosidase [Cutaneotrichosporon oleaginosum]TXT05355.1 hypothetical protein COLE_06675 [Cutaneotrichosporon oleaginosum]